MVTEVFGNKKMIGRGKLRSEEEIEVKQNGL